MARSKKQMIKRRNRRIMISLLVLITLLIGGIFLSRVSMPVLEPAGPIAAGQKQLLIVATLLMLIIVVPVFILAFGIAWRYRESNTKATYQPNWDHSNIAETIWWLIPAALIAVLAVITWNGTYKYDPHKPLASKAETMPVQVVALDWRWLFIYPEQKIASLNELRIPTNTSIKFDITADAPMNSFWIPQLGGQIYAMPGMGTQLHLMATKTGSYYGSSANVSGEGFAGMNFQTIASSKPDFDSWVTKAQSQEPLTYNLYQTIAKQNKDKTVVTYGAPDTGLYGTIISKYMKMDHSQHQAPEVTKEDHTHSHTEEM